MVTIIKKGTSKEKIKDILNRHARKRQRYIDLNKYCGVVKLTEEPLILQKQWRDEWE